MALTHGAVTKMMSIQQGIDENFTVDIKSIKKCKANFQKFIISDGQNEVQGFIGLSDLQMNLDEEASLRKCSVLRVTIAQHTTHRHEKKIFIQIIDFHILTDIPKQENYKTSTNLKLQNLPKPNKTIQIKTQSKIKREFTNMTRAIKKLDQQIKTQSEDAQLTDISAFQKISDLYQNFYGWQLLVRVIDKSYREFISKVGKHTKILTLMLMDRAGSIIEGSFFGDIAELRNLTICKGKVFRVSQGKIVEQYCYKQQKDSKYSKYSLLFYQDTAMKETKDIPQIPYCLNNFLRISQLCEEIVTQDYNFVGIVFEVGLERQLDKGDRKIIMQSFKMGDPLNNCIVQCVIWNRQASVQPFLDKSVLIKHFRVNKYKESLNLNSLPRNKPNVPTRLLKQLFEELTISNQPVVSNVQVWLNDIGFNQKWFYDACPNPKCRKAVLPNSKCAKCLFQHQQCSKRFMLPIQLVDSTGSIWVTAFDQAASALISNQSIDALAELSAREIQDFNEQRHYQQFVIQLSSKKDQFGRFTHTIIGRPVELGTGESVIENLRRIHEILLME